MWKYTADIHMNVFQLLQRVTISRLQQWLVGSVLTCFSLPLVKHGDKVLRILFHLSSLTAVIASSRGPATIFSCEHENRGENSEGSDPCTGSLFYNLYSLSLLPPDHTGNSVCSAKSSYCTEIELPSGRYVLVFLFFI